MALSRRQFRIFLVIGIVVGVPLGVIATSHIQNPGSYSGQPYIGASEQGPNVALPSGGTEANFEDFAKSDTKLRVETDSGNATFVSNGFTSAQADQLEGTWTKLSNLNTTGATLKINPDDKHAADISGDADTFEYKDSFALDDGTVDFRYSGSSGTTTVKIQNVPEDTTIGATDQHGDLLAVNTSTSSGNLTLSGMTNSDHDVQLITGENPELTDESPTGDLQSPPSEISVNVSDADFPDGDSVDVTIELDGSQIHSETVTSDSVVNTSIPSSGQTGGEHEYTITAEDEFNLTRTVDASYRVPDTLEIRNESAPSQLIDDREVNVQIFGENEVYERNTTGGTVSLDGLPVNEDFAVQASTANDYGTRTIYIQSIYDQQTVYLLNDSVATVESRFELEDPTGQFPPADTVLYISKPINRSGSVTYETVVADEFGTEGVTANLEEEQRYRLKIVAPDGRVQDMGPYRSDVAETVTLRPSGAAVDIGEFEDDFGATAQLDNRTLTAHYSDPQEETDSLTIWIHERGNTSNQLRANETYRNLGNLSTQYKLTENESKKEWVVNFKIDRNGEEVEKSVIVGNKGNVVPPDLDREWRLIAGIGGLLISAGAFSLLNRGVGAMMVGIEGGLLWWLGWLDGATSAAAIVLYLFVAVLYNLYVDQ